MYVEFNCKRFWNWSWCGLGTNHSNYKTTHKLILILSLTLSIFAFVGGIIFVAIFWKYRANSFDLQQIKKGTLSTFLKDSHTCTNRDKQIKVDLIWLCICTNLEPHSGLWLAIWLLSR